MLGFFVASHLSEGSEPELPWTLWRFKGCIYCMQRLCLCRYIFLNYGCRTSIMFSEFKDSGKLFFSASAFFCKKCKEWGSGLEAHLPLSHHTPLLTAGTLATPGTALSSPRVSSQPPSLPLTPVQTHFRSVGQVILEYSGRVSSLAPGRALFI